MFKKKQIKKSSVSISLCCKLCGNSEYTVNNTKSFAERMVCFTCGASQLIEDLGSSDGIWVDKSSLKIYADILTIDKVK